MSDAELATSFATPTRSFRTHRTLSPLFLRLVVFLLIAAFMMIPHTAMGQTSAQASSDNCLIALPTGSSVTGLNSVVLPDGTHRSYPQQTCGHRAAPTISDWVDKVTGSNPNGISMIQGYWTVPTAPSNVGGQTDYLFNAIQGVYNGQNFIIQPVLAFGSTICGLNIVGGNYWYLTSFLVFTTGACYYTSPIINPNVGDQIFGEVLWLSSNCSGGTTGYEIIADDLSLNTADDLYFCKSNMDPTVASAVLEAKNLNSCNEFPNQQMGIPSTDFTSISVTPTVSWTYGTDGSDQPQCGYAVTSLIQVHIHSYPTTDFYSRSHGLSVNTPLPNPWWPPYQSGYQFMVTSSAFDYYPTYVFNPFTSNYIQEAASGFVPSYAWHTLIYINGALNTQGDVGRNQILQASFSAQLTPNVRLDY